MLFIPAIEIEKGKEDFHREYLMALDDISKWYNDEVEQLEIEYFRKREDVILEYHQNISKWKVLANKMRDLYLWLEYEAELWQSWVKQLFGKKQQQ